MARDPDHGVTGCTSRKRSAQAIELRLRRGKGQPELDARFGVNDTVRDVRSASSVSNESGAVSTCSTVCVPRFTLLNSGDL